MSIHRTPQGKNYRLTNHARNRMIQRQIKKKDVDRVLDAYDMSYSDRKGNLCLIGELENGKRLRLVIAKDSDPLEIITLITLG